MEKLLTISIAAYNVADYIEETLESLVASKYIDHLEIFVIDDGGQDNTLEIARSYQAKFPDSIIPVHKENGGYGTTVNYSMEHATGKYFKLLDGDDWFDTEALNRLVEQLKEISTDVVITPFCKGTSRNEMEKVSFEETFGKDEYHLRNLDIQASISMWSITYKTSVLRSAKLTLPSKLFYTDQYFALMPFAKVETIRYFDFPVYQYRLGRDGQSVSRESRIKNLHMMVKIFKDLAVFIADKKQHPNYAYLFHRTFVTFRVTYRTFLLLPVTTDNTRKLREFDNEIKDLSPELYQSLTGQNSHRKLGYFIAICRKTNYKLFPLIKVLYPKGYPNF